MRDGLPPSALSKECGVVNLDSGSRPGTHWVAYYKVGPSAIYFDSYGLDPPKELRQYLNVNVRMQTFQLQGPNDVICGHLCLHVLRELATGRKFEDVVLQLFQQVQDN